MDDEPQATLTADLERLRSRARHDQRAMSTPLLTFGVLTIAAGGLPDGGFWAPGSFYWLVAGPVGFAVVAWVFRRREHRHGVGAHGRRYVIAAVILAGVFLFASIVLVAGGGMAACALALLVLAVIQRDALFITAATLFAAIAGAETLGALSNLTGLPRGVFTVAAGLILLLTGAYGRARETGRDADVA